MNLDALQYLQDTFPCCCPICESADAQVLGTFGLRTHFRCRGCGLPFSSRRPSTLTLDQARGYFTACGLSTVAYPGLLLALEPGVSMLDLYGDRSDGLGYRFLHRDDITVPGHEVWVISRGPYLYATAAEYAAAESDQRAALGEALFVHRSTLPL